MPEFAAHVQDISNVLRHIAVRETAGMPVFSPASTAEVAELLSAANERGLRVEIAGAGTKHLWGGQAEADLILETAKLAGIREHVWEDLTATVGAGTPWAEMQNALAAHSQMVALDPLWPERATVGGVLATNDSGLLRLRYGSARDLVIGMTIVLADGTIAKTGGKVVKNVAGYDLHKLMIGAYGTLAVATEVTFRLHPLPAARTAWSVQAHQVEPLGALLGSIKTSNLNPEGIALRGNPAGFALDVLLAGAPTLFPEKLAHLDELAAQIGVGTGKPVAESELWRARESMFPASTGVVVKATMLPSALAPALADSMRFGASSALAYAPGILYASMPSPESFAAAGRIAEQAQGTWAVVGQHGEPAPLMREIKRQFDAKRILNRGLLGGV